MHDERHSSEYTLNELLLLSIDKGITFNISEKGIGTIQNFECFTGKPPIRSRQEEGRVRKTLTLVYAEIDQITEKLLSKKMPSIEEGTVPAWNQERNKIAKMIQEKVIDTLSKTEVDIASKYKVDPPKRSSATVSGIMSRYDKVNTAKQNQAKVQLTDSMLNFLGKPPASTSSSSSSSSSSSKTASSSSSIKASQKNSSSISSKKTS